VHPSRFPGSHPKKILNRFLERTAYFFKKRYIRSKEQSRYNLCFLSKQWFGKVAERLITPVLKAGGFSTRGWLKRE
ncbi:MAG: hypothetical protein Q4A11_01210, partial [Brachymonas sp.]|nr:hypothetical protein [Brachymonas sp.]